MANRYRKERALLPVGAGKALLKGLFVAAGIAACVHVLGPPVARTAKNTAKEFASAWLDGAQQIVQRISPPEKMSKQSETSPAPKNIAPAPKETNIQTQELLVTKADWLKGFKDAHLALWNIYKSGDTTLFPQIERASRTKELDPIALTALLIRESALGTQFQKETSAADIASQSTKDARKDKIIRYGAACMDEMILYARETKDFSAVRILKWLQPYLGYLDKKPVYLDGAYARYREDKLTPILKKYPNPAMPERGKKPEKKYRQEMKNYNERCAAVEKLRQKAVKADPDHDLWDSSIEDLVTRAFKDRYFDLLVTVKHLTEQSKPFENYIMENNPKGCAAQLITTDTWYRSSKTTQNDILTQTTQNLDHKVFVVAFLNNLVHQFGESRAKAMAAAPTGTTFKDIVVKPESPEVKIDGDETPEELAAKEKTLKDRKETFKDIVRKNNLVKHAGKAHPDQITVEDVLRYVAKENVAVVNGVLICAQGNAGAKTHCILACNKMDAERKALAAAQKARQEAGKQDQAKPIAPSAPVKTPPPTKTAKVNTQPKTEEDKGKKELQPTGKALKVKPIEKNVAQTFAKTGETSKQKPPPKKNERMKPVAKQPGPKVYVPVNRLKLGMK